MTQSNLLNFNPLHNDYYGEVYVSTNLINGKQYVGQTVKDKKKTNYYYGSGKILKQALKKYGKKNFKREQIETCSNSFELDIRERYWIKELDTLTPKGYNMSKGGQGKSIPATQDWKDKASERMKKKWKDPKFKKKQVRLLKKATNTLEHKKLKSKQSKELWKQDDFREKLSKSQKESWNNPEIREKRIKGLIRSHNERLTEKQTKLLTLLLKKPLFFPEMGFDHYYIKYTIKVLLDNKFIVRRKEINPNADKWHKNQYKYAITNLGRERMKLLAEGV